MDIKNDRVWGESRERYTSKLKLSKFTFFFVEYEDSIFDAYFCIEYIVQI
jgi:hypothetical protein